MEAATWVFDHGNSSDTNTNTNTNTSNNNTTFQSPASHTPQQFWNFDSPDVVDHPDHNPQSSYSNKNDRINTNNSVSATTSTSASIITTNTSTHHHHDTLLDHKEELYAHNVLNIDMMESETHEQEQQGHAKEDLTSWAPIPGLHDLEMNLFSNDQNLILDTDVSSFDHDHNNDKPQRIPPTPSSFEISSYQNSHDSSFLQNFHSPMVDHQNHPNSIRPDVVFTPLVSPAVTPMDAMINKNHLNNHQQHSSNFFSPLTSPALEAKSPVKLKKSSSPEDSSTSPSSINASTNTPTTAASKKYSKRKTPGNTPIVGPTIPGRIAKQSPVIKAKRSSSYANNMSYRTQSQTTQQQQQLNSQHEPQEDSPEIMAPPKPRRARNPSQTTTKNQQQQQQQQYQQQYQQQPQHQHHQHEYHAQQNGTTPATPATLMNFKIDANSHSATTSPLIGPSDSSITTTTTTTTSRRSSSVSTLKQQHNNSREALDDENPADKKTSHKLAEQGRRNRMNQAIQDLGLLIPDEMNADVAIPSKATTVEMACLLIQNLTSENSYLREKLKQFNFEIESNESVSPLESIQSENSHSTN